MNVALALRNYWYQKFHEDVKQIPDIDELVPPYKEMTSTEFVLTYCPIFAAGRNIMEMPNTVQETSNVAKINPPSALDGDIGKVVKAFKKEVLNYYSYTGMLVYITSENKAKGNPKDNRKAYNILLPMIPEPFRDALMDNGGDGYKCW